MTTENVKTKPTMPERLTEWGPVALLCLGFYLQGAKNILAFSYWSIAAMLFCFFALRAQTIQWNGERLLGTGVFVTGLALSYIFSLDRSVSAFWTFQWFIFALLWIALPGVSQDGRYRGFNPALLVLAAFSLWVTFWRGQDGLLPVNYMFNSIWLAGLSVYFLLVARDLTAIRSRILYLIAGLLCLGFVIYGNSRGALVAIPLALLLTLWGRMPTKRLIVFGAVALVVIALLPGQWLSNRFKLYGAQMFRADRLQIWGIGAQAIRDYPLTGYGAGNFELAYQRHAFPVEGDTVRYSHSTNMAHNDALHLAAETGLPAAGIVVFGIALILRRRRKVSMPTYCFFLTLLIGSLFNSIFRMPVLAYLALLLAGNLVDAKNHSPLSLSKARWAARFYPFACLMGIVLACFFAVRGVYQTHDRWEKLVRLWPSDSSAWHALGFTAKTPRAAAPLHARAVQLSPAQPFYREAWARTLEASGDRNMVPFALQNYLETLALAPHRAINMLAIGRILYREGDPAAAQVWFERAKAEEPAFWEADLWTARTLHQQGQTKQAIERLEKLPAERDAYLVAHPLGGRELSPYESVIVAFNADVLKNEVLAYRRGSHSR